MNCQQLGQALDRHLDRELDAATATEVEIHLAACAECAAKRAERRELVDRVRREAPQYAAPAALRDRVRRQTGMAGVPRERTPRRPTWLHAAAIAALAATVGLAVGLRFGAPAADDTRREAVVVSHVASLAPPQRLVEVASSDRHSIKPWFAGRIDFAPPVRDLAQEGYTLLGARLDHVADRPAAVVIYRIRNHIVNLFVWRASAEAQQAPVELAKVRGFPMATWAQGGLRFAAVSDVDANDLDRFARLVQADP